MKVDFYGGVAEALVGIVFLDDSLGTVDDVLRNLVASHELEALLQVFYLALLGTDVVHLADTGLRAELDFEPRLVAGYLFELDTGLREKSLLHKSLHGVGDVVAGDGYAVANVEAGISEYEEIVVVRRTLYRDAGNLIHLRHGRIEHLRIIYGVGRSLRRSLGCGGVKDDYVCQ